MAEGSGSAAKYELWRSHFGENIVGSGTAGDNLAVPELSCSTALATIAIVGLDSVVAARLEVIGAVLIGGLAPAATSLRRCAAENAVVPRSAR